MSKKNNTRRSLTNIVTQAWQKQSPWLYLFLPISWLYAGISNLRYFGYQTGVFSSYKAKVPVLIIGNITVGGSGKSPLIISLVNYLQSQNINVGVISRGYGGDSKKMPVLVTLNSSAEVVGDEPCMIVQATKKTVEGTENQEKIVPEKIVPMAVCPHRQQAIELLLNEHPNTQIIISDDGLQHYKLQRDFEWIVVDAERGFGNQQRLPVGFLREPVSRLQGATVVYHQSRLTADKDCQLTMYMQADELQSVQALLASTIEEMSQNYQNKPLKLIETMSLPTTTDTVYAVSGIGYPQRFFTTLRSLGYQVIENPYPDHYQFSLNDLLHIAKNSKHHAIIITSKDAVKINQLIINQVKQMNEYSPTITMVKNLLARLFILPVTAMLNNACYQQIDDIITKLLSTEDS